MLKMQGLASVLLVFAAWLAAPAVQAQPARAPGGALHHAGGFQRLEVVLRGTHAAEAEGTRDFRLRGRHAFGVDAVGDEGVDGALGIGQAHG